MNETTSKVQAAIVIATIAAIGNTLLAIAHLGIDIPVLSNLGPSGGAVPPAVAAFTVGAAAFTAVAIGLARGASWARPLGLGLSILSILSGVGQFRGAISAISMALALALGLLLLRRPVPASQV